jgi:dihydrofolate synthase/folylpolyglutamate synthase
MSLLLNSLSAKNVQTFPKFQQLDARLGFPHRRFRSIHVGGTNGKGSVATKIASVLQSKGNRVGLYTSPHISTYRERIRINGDMIPESFAETTLPNIYDPSLSPFDLLTALAFLYFAANQVDYAVIEVGLGGRFDATNVIEPILTVITSIGLEHTAILGGTLEKIAFEKGGIVKPPAPLIVGASAAPFFPNAIHVEAHPFFELENRAIAKRALQELGIHSYEGLEVRPPCRFQQVGDLILDVAHNPQAFDGLFRALQSHFPGKKFPFFLGFSKDKDWEACVEIIRPLASEITFLKTENPRLIQFPNAKAVTPVSGVVAGSFYIMDEIQNR